MADDPNKALDQHYQQECTHTIGRATTPICTGFLCGAVRMGIANRFKCLKCKQEICLKCRLSYNHPCAPIKAETVAETAVEVKHTVQSTISVPIPLPVPDKLDRTLAVFLRSTSNYDNLCRQSLSDAVASFPYAISHFSRYEEDDEAPAPASASIPVHPSSKPSVRVMAVREILKMSRLVSDKRAGASAGSEENLIVKVCSKFHGNTLRRIISYLIPVRVGNRNGKEILQESIGAKIAIHAGAASVAANAEEDVRVIDP